MTAPTRRATTTPDMHLLSKLASTTAGWLLIAAAICVNIAVYRGAKTEPWVWAMATLVVIGAGALRASRHRRTLH